MKGRRPTPNHLARLRGGKLSARPTPAAGRPDCPDWLTPAASAEFGRVCELLDEAGLLSRLDLAAVAAYSQSFARWVEAEARVSAEGLTIGNRANPAAKLADGYLKQLRAFAVELGFTPASRGRLEAPPPPNDEGDELAAFLGED